MKYVSIKKIKIYNLQFEYNYLINIIYNLELHLDTLYNYCIITTTEKNNYNNRIYELIKHINSSYNDYLVNECNIDDNEDYDYFNSYFNKSIIDSDIDENNMFKILKETINTYKMININFENQYDIELYKTFMNNPFINIRKEIFKLTKKIGLSSILHILYFLYDTDYDLLMDDATKKMIQFYDKMFIPINISLSKNRSNKKMYIIKRLYQNDELLNKVVSIHILDIYSNDNNYLIIDGFFINDNINILLKSSQIYNRIIYNKKKLVEKLIEKLNIDDNFKINFMKHIKLYDIINLIDDYIYYDDINEKDDLYKKVVDKFNITMKEIYNNYINISNKSLQLLIKDFNQKNISITQTYYIIKYCLMNEDKITDANSLFNLIKDKKKGSILISNIIYNNLDFNLQYKLKKANINFKEQLEKIKSLKIEDIDMKKLLITSNNIPDYVKNLTLEKIDEMAANNADYYKQLLYVRTILKYPWNTNEIILTDNLINYINNLKNKFKLLSYGHKEAKNTLIKIIGKILTNPNSRGDAISLVGPPGVGKTLLAKSISSALDIPFVQITLGGQNDGEILHGHGYTYSGAQPGMIVKKMVEAGKSRCIMYFDELDKVCIKNGNINEISSILIHLTDPNMNKTFQDRFFQGIDFPLDKVIMIFSYNDSNLIDPILLDRLKEINIKPYNIIDKIKITQKFILPEIINNIGLNDYNITISNDNIQYIIENYTIEAGVRDLKRHIENILLSINIERIYGNLLNDTNDLIINNDIINQFLTKPNISYNIIHSNSIVGVINGLYATNNGNGGIIPIQIFKNFNQYKSNLKLTGNQKDIMKESVSCAYTCAVNYINNNLTHYSISNLSDFIHTNFPFGFHIHTPNTSTPKDGPSAGVAFCIAFISRILNMKIKNDIAITGEIDLCGNITKIGGLQYKLLGAKRANVKTVYIPFDNKDDINDIQKYNKSLIDDNFKVIFVKTIDEIINQVLI